MRITYSKNPQLRSLINNSFSNTTDLDGFIVDKKNGERVLSQQGENVTLSELGGFRKGSQIIIKRDVGSLAHYVDSFYLKDK